MKKIILSAISILLVLFTCFPLAAAERRVVRVGSLDDFPGMFKDTDGVVKGFYVDALDDLGRRENISFEYVHGTLSEGLERIKSGEVDALASVDHTPERALFLDYSKVPLRTLWCELYASPASGIDGVREVQGKKIAVVKDDYTAGKIMYLLNKIEINAVFVEMASYDSVFKAIASGQVAAGVVSSSFGFAKQSEYGLRSTGVVFAPYEIFLAVAKGKNRDLLALLDDNLVNWRQQPDSPYNNARQKWSQGNSGSVHVLSRWLLYSIAMIGAIVLLAMAFIMELRRKVKLKTGHLDAEIGVRQLKEKELLARNAELELISYTLSHELRSPLVTVKSFLGFLEKDLVEGNSERIKEDLDFMYTAADMMSQRLDGLLEMSRAGRVDNEPVSVRFSDLVQEVLTIMAGRIAGQGVSVQVAAAEVTLIGDRQRLRVVWQNLVENAVKYMGDQPAPLIEIGAAIKNSSTAYYVRDNGIGIDPRYHARIFNLFDKLDPGSEGTGAGLALVKRIVGVYDGSIWVESEGVGQGSCFWFTLPGAVIKE